MAMLFQSNPDRWDLRRWLHPGNQAPWYVTRYHDEVRKGVLVLFWEARGRRYPKVQGLYGWGIALSEATGVGRRRRTLVRYVERWVGQQDAQERLDLATHSAPITGDEIRNLDDSWGNDLLFRMPVGTNFRVSRRQLESLDKFVMNSTRFPNSQFDRAVQLELEGKSLERAGFQEMYVVRGVGAFSPQQYETKYGKVQPSQT